MSAPPDRAPSPGRAAGPPRGRRKQNPEARMSLVDHIRELRNRLIKVAAALAVATIVGWLVFHPVWHFLEGPYCKLPEAHRTGLGSGCKLFVNGLFDGFFLQLKVAFVVGLLISSPVWLYQIWAFVAPGLYARERRWAYGFVGAAVPLFALGAFFSYLAMSNGLRFLLSLVPGGVDPLITVNTYLSYTMAMLLIFGIAFEVPLIVVMLNLARVLTHARFRKWRRLIIFGVFLFAAAAVPAPDPFSMLILAIPCVALVEAAEVVIWANDRRRARRPDPYAGLADDEMSPLPIEDPADAERI